MPLRRISFSRKHNNEKMPNVKSVEKVPTTKTNGKCSTTTRSGVGVASEFGSDAPPTSTMPTTFPSPGEQRAGHTRSASITSSEASESNQSNKKDSKKLRRSSTSSSSVTSSKGLAHVRRTSRDCIIPEPIDLVSQLKISEVGDVGSPVFKIDEAFDHRNKSRPITLQRIRNEERDCISIQELAESPQRFGTGVGPGTPRDDTISPKSRLSVTSSHDSVDGEHMIFQPPSSPLLVAMRTAVDSLNQFDDFDVIEEIGSGFFADVFKVST